VARYFGEMEKAAAKERQREHGGTAPGKHSGKVTTSEGKARDAVAKRAGTSGRTLEKAQAVIEAAEAEYETARAPA